MSRVSIAATVFALAIATSAQAAEPISLRDMGSFHVGGRLVEISGKPSLRTQGPIATGHCDDIEKRVAHLAVWKSPGGRDEHMALTLAVPAFVRTTWQCERAA